MLTMHYICIKRSAVICHRT